MPMPEAAGRSVAPAGAGPHTPAASVQPEAACAPRGAAGGWARARRWPAPWPPPAAPATRAPRGWCLRGGTEGAGSRSGAGSGLKAFARSRHGAASKGDSRPVGCGGSPAPPIMLRVLRVLPHSPARSTCTSGRCSRMYSTAWLTPPPTLDATSAACVWHGWVRGGRRKSGARVGGVQQAGQGLGALRGCTASGAIAAAAQQRGGQRVVLRSYPHAAAEHCQARTVSRATSAYSLAASPAWPQGGREDGGQVAGAQRAVLPSLQAGNTGRFPTCRQARPRLHLRGVLAGGAGRLLGAVAHVGGGVLGCRGGMREAACRGFSDAGGAGLRPRHARPCSSLPPL